MEVRVSQESWLGRIINTYEADKCSFLAISGCLAHVEVTFVGPALQGVSRVIGVLEHHPDCTDHNYNITPIQQLHSEAFAHAVQLRVEGKT